MKNNDKNYDIYINERKILETFNYETSKSLDKSILTLAAGAFGLSIAFIGQISNTINKGTIYILVISWILLGISIIFTLISFITSQYACERTIEILEKRLERQDNINEKNIFSYLTKIINFISIILFILGLAFFAIFAIRNLAI